MAPIYDLTERCPQCRERALVALWGESTKMTVGELRGLLSYWHHYGHSMPYRLRLDEIETMDIEGDLP